MNNEIKEVKDQDPGDWFLFHFLKLGERATISIRNKNYGILGMDGATVVLNNCLNQVKPIDSGTNQ